MISHTDYTHKLESFTRLPLYQKLPPEEQQFLQELAFNYHLTFQEFRQVVEACRDLGIWGEGSLQLWWETQAWARAAPGSNAKNQFLQALRDHIGELRSKPASYPAGGFSHLRQREKQSVAVEKSEKKIFGMCPVASEKTVCCNLRTIDAVENCVFGCSYCAIQTFYSEKFVFDADFAQKLKQIPLDSDRFYHFGTGQSSDALAWGNRNGILDALCEFAGDHPNVLLEFKTKSDNVRYFLEREIPANVVCSWSLNTPTVVANEEHFTASLEERLQAARMIANRGVKVAFHFHPIIWYEGWQQDYPELVSEVLQRFQPEEVLFISFGSMTLIKPALQKMRDLGHHTKIHQAELVPDPHGKLTYSDDLKVEMFRTVHQCFEPWHGPVFMYLCMEKAGIWERTFGRVYQNNEEFEQDFGRQVRQKLTSPS